MLWIRLGLAITLKWGLRFTELAGIYFVPDPYRIIFPDIHKLFAEVHLLEKYRTLLKIIIIKHTRTQTRNLHGGQFTWSTQLIILNYPVILSYRRSTTVSLETYPLGTQNTGTAWPGVENGRMTNADWQTIEEQTNKPSNEQGHLLHNFKCFWTGIEYLIEYF